MATPIIRTPHPYYPRDLVLDHYVPNTNTVIQTLFYVSFAFLSTVGLVCLLGSPRRHSTLQAPWERFAFFWFILCGTMHILFEGYFGIYHATLAGDTSPVGQVWKEYAISDSRYLSSDSFVRTVEAITTLVWGPLALYCAWSLYHNLASRHIAQLMLSLGQIYGCTLYYFTSIFEGSPQCDPHPYYYYFYFWFFNIFWMVAPVFLIKDSIRVLTGAVVEAEEAGSAKEQKKRAQ
ncbi:hypothetical protein BGX29_005230 [Mortierella sp. GBA35]|nr:hypothetical protein BGX29_005230 [Mortierella sp. GBA35]